jgi:beta-1,4-mannosyltransferase
MSDIQRRARAGSNMSMDSHKFSAATRANAKAYLMPTMGLAYFALLTSTLRGMGWQVNEGNKFPRRGVLLGSPLTAIHIHMLDQIFMRGGGSIVWARLFYFLLVILPILRLRRIRLIWTAHELESHEGDPNKWMFSLSRLLAHVADHIIVHNTEMYRRVLALRPTRKTTVSIVPHGDLLPYYKQYIPHDTASVSTRSDQFVFGAIGYMRRNKGHDLILRAFRALPSANARLLMVGNCGDTIYKEQLERLACGDQRIVLHFRNLSDAELVQHHLSANVHVFAFRECPTSGSVITAMCLGRPVVAPNIGHVSDLVCDKSGWLYAPTDDPTDALLAAMLTAASDPAECHKRGAAAQLGVGRQDWRTIADQTTATYRGTLMNTRSQSRQ